MRHPNPRRPWRAGTVHFVRVLMFACVLLLIHRHHARLQAARRASGLSDLPVAKVKSIFPDADELGPVEEHGGRTVLSHGETIGVVLHTFPEAERFLGFSGPTDVLIGLDSNEKIVGMSILRSRDTQDHVALIKRDDRFLHSLNGKTLDQAATASVDAVSGATLTSLAMLQGLRARLGREAGSLKFPEPPSVELAQQLFPETSSLAQDSRIPEVWHLYSKDEKEIGSLLSNSPVADEQVGYQGPTRAYIGITPEDSIAGIIVGKSYDNEPYVGYVRDNDWFREILNDKTPSELAETTWEEAEIEGVSGATMTSQTVAQSLLMATARVEQLRNQQTQQQLQSKKTNWRSISTLIILVIGIVISFTSLRGKQWLRIPFQLVLIVYLGLINGDLLSTAMLVGWSQNGIPWENAWGLLILSAAALLLPIVARQNVYCDHLCPHGAVQQLLPRRWKLSRSPRWLILLLKWIRPILLIVALLAGMELLSLNLVNIEPFDAYAWRAAAWPTITVAVVGLIASLFIPMGYCQYGCPLGAILGHLRRHTRSDKLTRADALSALLLCIAIFLL